MHYAARAADNLTTITMSESYALVLVESYLGFNPDFSFQGDYLRASRPSQATRKAACIALGCCTAPRRLETVSDFLVFFKVSSSMMVHKTMK